MESFTATYSRYSRTTLRSRRFARAAWAIEARGYCGETRRMGGETCGRTGAVVGCGSGDKQSPRQTTSVQALRNTRAIEEIAPWTKPLHVFHPSSFEMRAFGALLRMTPRLFHALSG